MFHHLCILALAAAPFAAAQEAALAGSEWRALGIAGEEVPEGVEALLRFGAEGGLTGSGGCNRFTGAYAIEGEGLTIGPLAATRMACPEPAMTVEGQLFAALGAVRGFARDRTELVLSDEAGAPLVVLAQTDWD